MASQMQRNSQMAGGGPIMPYDRQPTRSNAFSASDFSGMYVETKRTNNATNAFSMSCDKE